MEKRVASVLLLISQALVLVAGLSAATSGTAEMDTIRLPSDTALVPERMAVVRGETNGQERPWKCCDRAVPGPTTEGMVWYCLDKVEQCTCDRCFELGDSHSYYCLDGYQGSDPGPTCSHVPERTTVVRGARKHGQDHFISPVSERRAGVADLVSAMATTTSRHGGNGKRPWKCCDNVLCDKTTYPPRCRCLDTLVGRCYDACKDCEESDEEEESYTCNDWYSGERGPRCSRHMNTIRLPNDIELVPERIGAMKHGEKRPWKCCDKTVRGPTTEGVVWYCMDKVEKCTCESCYELKDSHSYFCLDGYQGSDPGPSCSHA